MGELTKKHLDANDEYKTQDDEEGRVDKQMPSWISTRMIKWDNKMTPGTWYQAWEEEPR